MTEAHSTNAFLEAVKRGDAAEVDRLLSGRPSLVAARDAQGVSAPLLALYHRKAEMAELLAARKQAWGKLDVFEAAAFGRLDALDALLTADATLANAHALDGFYPLGLAAFFGHEAVVALLLSRGADPDLTARNPMKVRALHAAAAARSLPIARRLLDAGAEPNARQQEGFSPLHEAAASGQLELARLLLDRGADPGAGTDDGRTALSLARKAGHEAMAELLSSRVTREP